jgi:hypothetical protein
MIRQINPASYRFVLIAVGVLFTFSTVGCNRGPKVEFAKVQGVVRVNGQPQKRALIQFSPDREKGNGLPILATGTSDEEGKYSLKYGYRDKVDEGAPVGWHRVTVLDTTVGATPQGQEPKPSAIPMNYSMPATTPLLVEVKTGDNSIDLDVKK